MTTTVKVGGSLFLMAVLLLAVWALAAAGMPAATAHADARHGAEAEMARQCRDNWQWKFFNPDTKRTAYVCLTDLQLFGVYIEGAVREEVTAFLKNKLRNFDQVERYLINRGYVRMPH